MLARAWAVLFLASACAVTGSGDRIAARFPAAQLDDRALCDRLLALTPGDATLFDLEPRTRRKVIVSDLHLGPGTTDTRFTGIEDFYAEAAWTAFLARQAAAGPTDLIINGDFIEFWQIAAALGALPKRTDARQPAQGSVLGADQSFGVTAVELVIAAHRSVFTDLGKLLDGGDHRVIIVAGNHDADLLWPKVQLAIARAIQPRDPSRLLFPPGSIYEHGGVHVEHGHAFDAANRFATGHAPFGRDRDGTCRLQSSWGEVFVDQFYTDVERRVPFIDNLYPQSAAILWAMRDNPDSQRDAGDVMRFIDVLRQAQSSDFNQKALVALIQSALGMPGARDWGPESVGEVIEHVGNRLVNGDASITSLTDTLLRFRFDPELEQLWTALARAGKALPNYRAALGELRAIDARAYAHLRDVLFGDPLNTAAARLLGGPAGVSVVVLGHTHTVGGSVEAIRAQDRTGFYANTGSWISAASVADLRARGVAWEQLNLADRTMFPSRNVAVAIEYAGGVPQKPVLVTGGP